MRIFAQPRDLAELTEIDPAVPSGEGDRFSGYGVMGQPFRSGDVLAFRRFPASSLGYGYASVWHRDADGRWTFWSDIAPASTCARFFGCALERVAVAPIRVTWPGARRLRIVVGAGIIDWSLELAATPATLLLNALAGAMPRRLWRWAPALHALGRAAGSLLGAERVSLAGRASNGQRFIAEPARVWVVRAASAAVGGRSLGSAGPLPTQAFLGDLAIPQRGLFVVGRACFESFDPRRHSAALLRSEVRAEPIPQGSGTV